MIGLFSLFSPWWVTGDALTFTLSDGVGVYQCRLYPLNKPKMYPEEVMAVVSMMREKARRGGLIEDVDRAWLHVQSGVSESAR